MSAHDHLILINATGHLILAAKRFLKIHCNFDAIADDDDAHDYEDDDDDDDGDDDDGKG